MGGKKQVNLTLKIDEDLHYFFKKYAKEHRDSMTRLILQYIRDLKEAEDKKVRK